MRRAMPSAERMQRAREVRKRLAKALPEPRCELDHNGPWQLLIATILSAQSTDARVNQVTPELFAAYPTPRALADAELGDVERIVRTTGFYRNKAKAIVGASRVLWDRHGGQVPRSLAALVELPGVARKTANLVLGTAFGIASGFIVDTHAGRVSRRLDFTEHDDPTRVEHDLCALFAKRDWIGMGHRLVLHGRYVCLARKPACAHCPLHELCPSAQGEAEGSVAERVALEQARVGGRKP